MGKNGSEWVKKSSKIVYILIKEWNFKTHFI